VGDARTPRPGDEGGGNGEEIGVGGIIHRIGRMLKRYTGYFIEWLQWADQNNPIGQQK
jgi:hypothetical protein